MLPAFNLLNRSDVAKPPEKLQLHIIKEANKNMNKTPETKFPSKAAIRRADRDIKKKALATLVKDHNLNFAYLRDYDDYMRVVPNGGMVIAYQIPSNKGTVVEVATAICSNHDVFDKLEGKILAASNFAEGKRIKVKLAKGVTYGQQLATMFST